MATREKHPSLKPYKQLLKFPLCTWMHCPKKSFTFQMLGILQKHIKQPFTFVSFFEILKVL
jgi:hypothetical protein